jgi:hypothetical protein
MTGIAIGAALVAIAIPLAGAIAQALSPTLAFEGNTATPAKNDATQTVHIVVQSWGIAGQEDEIPLRGFYVAHLLSGQISTTIDGQMTDRQAWRGHAGQKCLAKSPCWIVMAKQ